MNCRMIYNIETDPAIKNYQVNGNRAEPLRTRRFHVIDTVGARDDTLERSRNETAYEVCVRTHVRRRHPNDRHITARILPHAERPDGLQPGDEDHETDDDREDRPFDE